MKVISHWWAFDLLKVGKKRPLVIDDIDNVDKYDSSEYLLNKFLTNWSNEISNNPNNPNLFWAIANTIGIKYYLFLTFLLCLRFIFLIINLIFLQEILTFIENCGDSNNISTSESDYRNTIACCIGVCVCQILGPTVLHYTLYNTTRLGIDIRQVMTAIVLYKVLKISSNSIASAQVINLMSTDAQRYVILSGLLLCNLCRFLYCKWSLICNRFQSIIKELPFPFASFPVAVAGIIILCNRVDSWYPILGLILYFSMCVLLSSIYMYNYNL